MPVSIIFSVIMIAISVAMFYYNKILGFVFTGVSIAVMVVMLALVIRFRTYVHSVVHSAMEDSWSPDERTLENIKLPAAVCGINGELLMYNSSFYHVFLKNEEGENVSVAPFIDDSDVSFAIKRAVFDSSYGGRRYTVVARRVRSGCMLEFFDDTDLKNTSDKFRDTKKSVALIAFDNIEDFSDADQEAATAHLSAENLLYRWANKHSILLRKLGESRYIAVFDERVLKDQTEKKFRILDRIRSVSYNGRPATISIGVGHDFESLTESAAMAKKALEMALSRGGDQVAVLTGNDYAFFGGVSKGVERTSKVKVRVMSEDIEAAVKEADQVLIMGHKYSDLDCIGSAAGMYALMTRKYGKPCHVICDTEHTLAKVMIDRLQSVNKDMFVSPERGFLMTGSKTLMFIVDTHSPDFAESAKAYKNCGKLIIIDHHRRMVNYIDTAAIFLHEPSASSTCELVTEVVGYLAEDAINHIEAEALLAGIMLDTKNFVINTGVRTFEAAAYLRKKGADTVTVRNIFANSLENYRDKSRLVSAARIYKHCAITVADRAMHNSRVVCAQAADDLLSIEDTYASFVISPIDLDSVNISARSFGKINVQIIMEELGGGGHQTMAAAQLAGVTLEEARDRLIEALDKTLDN